MSKSNKIENRGGVIIIVIVGMLAAMEVIKNNWEEEIAKASYKHVSYSNWYNAKSIKLIMKENQRDYLESLLASGVVADGNSEDLIQRLEKTNMAILKYEEEKVEILEGSANIPKSSWSQDLDGEMGKIVGLKKWEEISTSYANLVAKINISLLFLQISIVFGVVGLIISDNLKLQQLFTNLMIGTGFVGIAIGLYAYSLLV
ncbi:DUF4337 family protein [Kriegella aquimaris]|uniref:DUF4337 domain-containing protein n=1 Tax=Kriegella aquimaris TaxID=192904 RepID=A0A1G9K0G7_9FLAO|nr:DUF4337 family protein [Kriegella aquimaris]SDL43269.1 protein of unknown function [Kriegella aquimaris]